MSRSMSTAYLDTPDFGWRKSSRCSSSGCVEVRITSSQIGVRDSKIGDGPVLVFDREEWAAFVAGVKAGEFDLLPER